MSKRSTVTLRDRPVVDKSLRATSIHVRGETLKVNTRDRVEIIDLTDRLMSIVHDRHVQEGLVSVFSLHTTCAVFINEVQTALIADIKGFLERLVPRDGPWIHNDPAHSDCDRVNADAHLRAIVLGHSLSLQVSGGEVVLGQWQRILMAELDGPRSRTIRISVMGIA